MVNFAFDKAGDTAYANRYFWGRSPIVCIACIGIASPLFLLSLSGDVGGDSEEWFDVPNYSEHPFVCQKETLGSCGTWTTSSDGMQCHKFYRFSRTQAKAQQDCQEDGATLAMPKTSGENADVYALCGEESPCWIGLRRSFPGSESWEWFDGTSLSWSNWEEGEPNNVDGNEDAAVVGCFRWGEEMAAALFFGAITGCVCVVINISVVLGICICVYMALTGANKNDSLVMVAAIADAYCGFWLCIGILGTIMRMMSGDSSALDFVSIIFSVIQLVLLCILAACGFQLRNKIQEEKRGWMNAGQQGYGGYGQPVGQVIVGQPEQGTVVIANAAPA